MEESLRHPAYSPVKTGLEGVAFLVQQASRAVNQLRA